jgi:fructose-1,6-bisphosphatase/inositol monophosphatase family enzyme
MTHSTDEFRPETLVAIDAVKRALAIARRGIGAEDVTAKGGRDLVTVTDVAVEDAVRGLVADALGFSVIGEERGGEASADGSPYWLVDPICHAGAGSLLVTEAGGTLSDLDGRPWTIRSDALVGSANPDLHEELLDLARSLDLPL